MERTLSRQTWIEAGLARLAALGVDSVRVEPLARQLGVTKGSFYWHFQNRAAFLEALLESWRVAAVGAIVEEIERESGSGLDLLRRLSRRIAREDGRVDTAVRAWAAHDAAVKRVLDDIDSARVAYLEKLYAEIGFAARPARARAEFVYQALVGRFVLSPAPLSVEQAEDRLSILLPVLTRLD